MVEVNDVVSVLEGGVIDVATRLLDAIWLIAVRSTMLRSYG